MELHQALVALDLTTLALFHDHRSGATRLELRRDWDDGVEFSRYAHDFHWDSVPRGTSPHLGDVDGRAALAREGCGAALQRLETLVREGRHEMIVLKVHRGLGIRACNNVHSSVLGRGNGLHAVRAGGIRRHEPDEAEGDVLVDGLNLGRAMSFKNAAAEIPFGGTKMTVQCEPFALDDLARLGFIAYCIDSGRFMTGPDMGFPTELSDALRGRFTRNILGGPGGSMGPTGTPTAAGCFAAMCEAANVVWGGGWAGKTVAIQGIGAVGLPLARLLREAGARLVVSDVSSSRLQTARAELGDVTVVEPGRILGHPCDVLSPCAHGGVLDEATIAALDCRMVYGSANNQLAATSVEREIELAARLAARGILYQPDWTHNTAGVMAGYEEYLHQENARMDRVMPRVRKVCGDGTRDLLRAALASGRTPTAVAYERIERRIYGAPA